tara:strand:- start:10008 stop:11357 length:1350 start_codon:yes stop_codon:yes gene_type:complete
MATWNIQYEPHGKFVTCQRPIVVSVEVTDGAVAHFTGKLYLKGNTWEDTGLRINAYGDNNGLYSFNLAEYCRQFFVDDGIYSTAWCATRAEMVAREFYLEIYPVEYNTNGDLIPNQSDTKDTDDFFAVPINTTSQEQLSSNSYDNVRIDAFVFNGNNDSSAPLLPENSQLKLSNMPDYNVVNIDAGFFSRYEFLQQDVSGTDCRVHFTNDSGITYFLPFDAVTGYNSIGVHPVLIDNLLTDGAGFEQYAFTDAAGNVTSKTLKLQVIFRDTATGFAVRTVPPAYFKYESNFGCSGSDTFLFRNMRGGFDFFTATGTKTSNVELSGTTFDRHTDFSRASSTWDRKVGEHNITNLWNSRKDTFTIFTQPLTKEYALWIEELIVSPEVWIIKKTDNFSSILTGTALDVEYNDLQLVAINIDKGSYKLHTTEKNVNFVELKYSLSENTLIQKT